MKSFQLQAGIPADGECAGDEVCEASVRKALGIGAPSTTRAVLDLQADLKRLGFYNGPLDGKGGPTLDAGRQEVPARRRHPRGQRVRARCQSALNRALGLDDPALPAGAAPTTPKTVIQLQSDLKSLGVYNGPLDGKGGPSLTEAIKQFQYSAGIPADGKCGARCQHELVKALSR